MTSTHQSDPCIDETFTPRHHQDKINVFISSTFLDMKAERDELTLRIFPYLRKICEERGIAWGEVDLRWGIPEEKTGEALSICMQYIDRCRPYFIGMLGERYGWVDEEIPKSIIEDYPWLDNHHGKSITELEFIHGVLNNPEMNGYAFFYFRDPEYLKTLSPEEREEFQEKNPFRIHQLAELKRKVRESKYPVRENYSDPIAFGELVKEDLLRIIDSLTPPPKPQADKERADAWLDREEIAHETFAESRFGVYVRRQEYFDRLNSFVDLNNQPIVITGTSGSGKSALLAHWGYQYRNSHPDDFVLLHFVGASSESSNWAMMLRRFMGEFKRRLLITSDIPEKEEELRLAFANWLSMAGKKRKVILIIDGLNQLEDRNGAPDLVWLPPVKPENVHIFLSTLPGRSLDAARARGWDELEVEPLCIDERKRLISCYLKRYNKELSCSILDDLASAHQNDNPLFLRALLEEIRIHGEYSRLNEQIEEYLTAETVVDLYGKILARYERDYERDRPNLVKDTVSLIWASRRGLSKTELMDLLGSEGSPLADAIWAPLYLAMEHSLVEKGGLITFFHEYFRDAVVMHYLNEIESQKKNHLILAYYFDDSTEGYRVVDELPWQFAAANEWEKLVKILIEPQFLSLLNFNQYYDLLSYWVRIETQSSFRIEKEYKLNGYNRGWNKNSQILISYILLTSGHPREAEEFLSNLNITIEENSWHFYALQINLAEIYSQRGESDEALNLLITTESIVRKKENLQILAKIVGSKANILHKRCFYDDALNQYNLSVKIRREIEDYSGLATSIGNKGFLLMHLNDFNGAMNLHKEAEKIHREIGDLDGLARDFNNQASILLSLGYFDKALLLLEKSEKIRREIGYKRGLAITLHIKSQILSSNGDIESALVSLKESENLFYENEDTYNLSLCFYTHAQINSQQHRYFDSFTILKKAYSLASQHGYSYVEKLCFSLFDYLFKKSQKFKNINSHFLKNSKETLISTLELKCSTGQYSDTFNLSKKLVDNNKESTFLLTFLIWAMLELGRKNEAITVFDKLLSNKIIIDSHINNFRQIFPAFSHREKLLKFYRLIISKDLSGAIDIISNLSELTPELLEYQEYQIYLLACSNQKEKVQAIAEHFELNDTNSPTLRQFQKWKDLYITNHSTEEISSNFPYQGILLFYQEKYDEALHSICEQIVAMPIRADLWTIRALCYEVLGRSEEALYSYEIANKIYPCAEFRACIRRVFLISLSNVLENLNSTLEMAKNYLKIIEFCWKVKLTFILEEYVEKLLSLYDESAEVLAIKGAVAHIMADYLGDENEMYNQALQYYEKATFLKNDPIWLAEMGIVHMNLSDYEIAINLFLESLQLDPTCWQAHSGLAWALPNKNLSDEARFHGEEAVRLNPYDWGPWNNLANTLNGDEERELLLKCRKKAIECSPHEKIAYHNYLDTVVKYGGPDDYQNVKREYILNAAEFFIPLSEDDFPSISD